MHGKQQRPDFLQALRVLVTPQQTARVGSSLQEQNGQQQLYGEVARVWSPAFPSGKDTAALLEKAPQESTVVN